MKRPFLFFVLSLTILFLPQMVFPQTDIYGGTVSGTWSESGSPYRIFDHILIPDDSTLRIESGITVEFQGHFRINVLGNIKAEGSSTDSIHFTINDTTGFSNPNNSNGGWGGVRIIDTPDENDSSVFEYCVFQYGKAVADYWHDNAGGAICIIQFDKVRITNCLFSHNMAGGSEVPSGGAIHLAWADVKINHNKFHNNRADAGGAIQMHESDPVFEQNVFSGNRAREGGGISIGSLSNPTFEHDTLVQNVASQFGGGIMCWDRSVVQFKGIFVEGNNAPWGGGIGMAGIHGVVDESTIKDNIADNLGGGIASDYSYVTISNSEISGNSASMSGGIHAWYDTLMISNSQLNENIADLGAGMHSDFSQISIHNSVFRQNSAYNGAGIHLWNCDILVDSTDFLKNTVENEGGAIEGYYSDTLLFDRSYRFNLNQCQFVENDALFRSGAVKIEQMESDTSFVDVMIDQCMFYSNHAERVSALLIRGNLKDFVLSNTSFLNNKTDLWNGGASFALGCTGQVINCLFTDNQSTSGNPGAAGSSHGSFVHFVNCTFANNSATTVGGLSAHRDGKASVTNCIFWNNTARQVAVRGIQEGEFSELYVNHSNIQYGMDSIQVDSLAALYWGSGNISEDPLFYDPDNGDYHLQDESPCIDAGADSVDINGAWLYAPDRDMDMNKRPQEGSALIDMGAFENQDVLAISSSLDSDYSWITTFPNPFNHRLKINLILHEPSLVSITIYSITGRKVADIIHQNVEPGEHHFYWKPEHIGGGMYIMNYKSDLEDKSMIILHLQ